MQGLICRGPELEDDEPTYVLLEDWVGPQRQIEPEAALAELARRDLAGYGPPTTAHFARWAGLEAQRARQGFQTISSELAEVVVAGEKAWMLARTLVQDASRTWVRLLPAFDAYLLGYGSRDLALPRRFARRIQAGGGWIHPAVVMGGLLVGTWRLPQRGQRPTGHVQPLHHLDTHTLPPPQ